LSEIKSNKELAFLKDLYVATDWGERFAAVIDEHVKLPEEGRILYVEAGTGGHAMALHESAEEGVGMLAVDESEECLELAQAKSVAMNIEPEFRKVRLDALELRDNQFELVIGDGSLVSPKRVPKMLSEMARVSAPNGTVVLVLLTASSFGEFFSIYWEALQLAGLSNRGADVEELIRELPSVIEIEETAEKADLKNVTTATKVEEFPFESGEEFLNSPLITDFLLKAWLQTLSNDEQALVIPEIARLVDVERQDADFLLSVKATLVVGTKTKVVQVTDTV
jgi:ubiquinone/menaquinone biosynthesis C-methylase UbiE